MANPDEVITLKLGKSMTLADAQNFYAATAALRDDAFSGDILIDAVENEVIEFPILQILAAVSAKASSNGSKIIWENPSIALFEKSMELGLDEALGL